MNHLAEVRRRLPVYRMRYTTASGWPVAERLIERGDNVIRWALIIAGGEGERLRPLTNDRPKPMVQVAGRVPRLERIRPQLAEVYSHLVISMRLA